MSDRNLQPGTLLLTSLPILLFIVPAGLWVHGTRVDEMHDLQMERVTVQAELVANRLRTAVIDENRGDSEAELQALHGEPSISAAVVRDRRGRQLARLVPQADSEAPPWLPWVRRLVTLQKSTTEPGNLSVPVPLHASTAGSPDITAEAGRLEIRIKPLADQTEFLEQRGRFLLLFSVAVTALLLYSLLVARWLSSPLVRMSTATRELVDGISAVDLPLDHGGAIGEAANAIQTLAERLTTSRGDQTEQIQRATRKLQDDVERLRVHNNELQVARREHERSDRSKSTHVSHISQTLRQPLTTLVGFIDLLERTSLSREQRDYVRTLQRSSARLLANMNSLLDWSREDGGLLRDRDIGFDLRELLEDLIYQHAPDAYANSSDIRLIIYRDVPAHVLGHPVWLSHALAELLANAVHHTADGHVTLRVSLERQDGRLFTLAFAVEDNGPGMAEQEREQLRALLTGADTTADGAVRRKLGLAKTRNLIQLMGGQLHIDSKVGHGTSVSFVLSLHRDDLRIVSTRRYDGLRNTVAWIHETEAAQARSPLYHLLEEWGLRTTAFTDRLALNQRLRQSIGDKPDIVIISCRGKDLDDSYLVTLIDACRDNDTPCTVLVTSVSADVMQRIEVMGATAALPRCVPRERLFDTLQVALRATNTSDDAASLSGLHVLVADNSRANRVYVAQLVESLGATTDQATNGEEAVAKAGQQKFALILMDVRMPAMGGGEATQWIRSQPNSNKDTLIVGISAYVESGEKQALLDAGMNDVLIKPFDAATLLRCLSAWLPQVSGAEDSTTAANEMRGVNAITAPARDLLALLERELPEQMSDIDDAIEAGEAEAARDCCHVIHGTAAFYRLDRLRQAARRLEMHLAQSAPEELDSETTRAQLGDVRLALHEAMGDVSARLAASESQANDQSTQDSSTTNAVT